MKLNHSRYLDYGAKAVGDRAYERAKSTPTAKQIRFYKRLYAMCKEHNVDPRMDRYTRTRMDYAMAIDALIERLKKHGVDINGNGKDVNYVLTHGSDRRGRYYTNERIGVKEKRNERYCEGCICYNCRKKTGCTYGHWNLSEWCSKAGQHYCGDCKQSVCGEKEQMDIFDFAGRKEEFRLEEER